MPDADNINRRAKEIRLEKERAEEARRQAAASAPRRSETRRREAEQFRTREQGRRKLAAQIASYALRNNVPPDHRHRLRRLWVAGRHSYYNYDHNGNRIEAYKPVYAALNGEFYTEAFQFEFEGKPGKYVRYKFAPAGMDEAIANLVARGHEPWK